MSRSIRWEGANASSIEHLALQETNRGIVVESVVIGTKDGAQFGASYRIALDPQWRVQAVELKTMGSPKPTILYSDGEGHWQDAQRNALPKLDGCIDVDISITPFTNTLPIRRLRLSEGASQTIKVVYFPSPDFEPIQDEQRYTCREMRRRYLYEGLARNRSKELTVDEDGIVVDYPGLFQRERQALIVDPTTL